VVRWEKKKKRLGVVREVEKKKRGTKEKGGE